MIKAVVDTNVIVSALLTPDGSPAKVVALFFSGAFDPVVSDEILHEYSRVLARSELGLDVNKVHIFLGYFTRFRLPLPPAPAGWPCTDPDDTKFIDAAFSGKAHYIVTGNKKHFPEQLPDITIISPHEFLLLLSQ